MKGIQLFGPEPKRLGVDTSRKEIDWVPDASGFQHAVQTGQKCHGYASCKSTLHARRNWISVNRKPCTLGIRYGNTLDNAAFRGNADIFCNHGHGFFMLARKDF